MRTIFSKINIKAKDVIKVIILLLLASLAEMLLPTMLAQMIDIGIPDSNMSAITTLAIIMAVLAVVACVTNIASAKISARISTNLAADIRKEIFYKIQTFSSVEMDEFGTASLVTRSTSDVTNIQTFFNMLLRIGILAPLMAVAGLVLSSMTGGELSSVLFISIPVLLITTSIIVFFSSRYTIKLREKLDLINKKFLESIEGVRVIRAFNKQRHEMNKFAEINDDYTKTFTTANRLNGLMMPTIQVIFGLTTAAVMGAGSYFVSTGSIDVGQLVANSQYISMILMAIIMLAVVITMFPTSHACAKRIAAVLEADVSIKDGKKTLDDRTSRASVVFDNVTFAYPDSDEPVISNISFESNPGEITAIIGRTGSGKSSVLQLIPRLYDVTVGHIYVDGVDVKKYKLDDLRSLIGYVPQKNVLFSGDISSNLNWGDESGSESDWEKAAEIACAKEFIDKKDGAYHSEIAQGGTNLSGGQRQRMAIARAVMKKPEIYVFDDSFSALDVKTDMQLRKNLRASMGEATIIMVAQRMSTVMDADRIIVLDEGKMVGMGTHKELLKSCELYREIAVLQLGEEVVSNEN